MAVVGIDFGSQACYVCVARQGGVETIDNDYSDRRTPTVVAYGPDRRLMGVSAKNQMVTNPKNTITGFRNLLGRGFSDPIAVDEVRNVPFTVEERKDNTIGFKVNHLGNEEVLTPQQVTVAMLSHLKAIAETALKTKVTDCVVSVPAHFTDSQRRALLDSCQAIQLNCLRLINDTTAAALAYGIYKQDLPEEKEKSRNVVFVDLGYTGLQVAVCAFNKGKLKVLSKGFRLGVGGRYFDECLVNHFAEEFKKKYNIDGLAKPRHRLRLTNECEKLKKLLSANNTNLPINIESFVDDKDVTARMNREELQQLCSGLFEKIQETLAEVLGKAQLTVEDIHSVEIIGGSCRIPAVKEIITNTFKKTPSTMLNMDEAVARGCALQCAILSPTFRVRDFNITDIQPFPIKLLWESKLGEEFQQNEDQLPSSDMIVFKEGDHIGVSKMLTFYRKEPFFLQAEYADPLVVPSASHVIGRFSVKNVVPAVTGEPSKLKVKVRVNTHGIFGVMNAYIVEKTVVEEPPPPPPAANTAGGEAAAAASATPTSTKEQTERQEETKSMEDDVQKQNGKTKETKPKDEAQTDDGKGQNNPPDVKVKSEGNAQESNSTGQESQFEPMDTEPTDQQQTQSEDTTDNPTEKPGDAADKPANGAELPKEPAEKPSAANGKEKEAPSEPKKAKKQVKHIDLPVDSVTFSLSKADLNAVMEAEGKMHAQDRKQIEKANARNAVEEYVYDIKEKLETIYKEFITEQVHALAPIGTKVCKLKLWETFDEPSNVVGKPSKSREQFLKLLSDTEDWLYEEGEDESKTVYNEKLEELKKQGDPIVKRVKEFEGRSAAFDQLGGAVVRYEKKLTQYKEGNEELAHIAAEEMKKVEEAVQKKQQWMHEQLQKFDNLPKSADPSVTIAQITAEAKLLSTTCDPIVNKPKPKVEPPKDEGKKEEGKKDGEKDGKNTAQQTGTERQQDTTQNTSQGDAPPASGKTGTENTTNSIDMDVD